MMKKLKKSNEKGFTLVELMVTLAIIGILMAIAIPNYIAYRTRGANTTAKTEAQNFYHAALAQVADTGTLTTFSLTNPPEGFTSNSKVTLTGNLTVPLGGFSVSGLPTFNHTTGTSTYTILTNGTVSP